MFRFTIRDVLWATVVVGLCLALRSAHIAYRAEKSEFESLKFWNSGLERAIEDEGYFIAGAHLGTVELIPIPADQFPTGLSRAERRRRFHEFIRNQEEKEPVR